MPTREPFANISFVASGKGAHMPLVSSTSIVLTPSIMESQITIHHLILHSKGSQVEETL